MNYVIIIRIAVFAEKIKHKHHNYNIMSTDLRAAMQSEALINWLNWNMIDKNNMHLFISEFVQSEWQDYVDHSKHWEYLIKLMSESINTATEINNSTDISERSELSESAD